MGSLSERVELSKEGEGQASIAAQLEEVQAGSYRSSGNACPFKEITKSTQIALQ
jgi:hypothetical protein